MKNTGLSQIKETLEGLYTNLDGKPIDYEYLLGIYDYISYIKKTPFLKEMVEKEILNSKTSRPPKKHLSYPYLKLDAVFKAIDFDSDNEEFRWDGTDSRWEEIISKLKSRTQKEEVEHLNVKLMKEVENKTATERNPFLREKYQMHLNRVHRALLDRLHPKTPKKTKAKVKGFDSEREVLIIGEYEVKFPQTRRKNGYAIFRALFSGEFDFKETNYYREIEDEAKLYEGKEYSNETFGKRYYKVCLGINGQIEKDTKEIVDFFEMTTKTMKINPDYL